MKITTDMICCKPLRQQFGLGCPCEWMASCLAAECAKLPTLNARRQFAGHVAHIERMQGDDVQALFRAEVKRRYETRKKAA